MCAVMAADFSLFKNFNIYKDGRVRAEFRAESYNLFNHPWFGLPESVVRRKFFRRSLVAVEFATANGTRSENTFLRMAR